MWILRVRIPNTANRWTILITNYLYLSFDVDLVWGLLAEHEYGQFHENRSGYLHLPTYRLEFIFKNNNGGDFSPRDHCTCMNVVA
jgi:hypothetical protein